MLASLLFAAAMSSISPDAGQSLQSKNGEFIFSQYPPRALAAGEQGSVRFQTEVDDKGNPLSCKVTASSGYKRLDQETCDLIIDHATFKPALDSEGKASAAVHDGIVNWRIPGGGVTQVAASNAKALDEVVCKRITKTGSLVSHSRLCMTRREWNQYADRNQGEWGEMQGRFGSSREDQPTFPGN